MRYSEREPRFVREYISYKKRQIKENPFWDDSRKETAYVDIDRVLKNLKRGLITIDEALKSITEIY